MFNWKGIGVWSDSLMQSIPSTFPSLLAQALSSQNSAHSFWRQLQGVVPGWELAPTLVLKAQPTPKAVTAPVNAPNHRAVF